MGLSRTDNSLRVLTGSAESLTLGAILRCYQWSHCCIGLIAGIFVKTTLRTTEKDSIWFYHSMLLGEFNMLALALARDFLVT